MDRLSKSAGDPLLHDVVVVLHPLDVFDRQAESDVEAAEAVAVTGQDAPDPALFSPAGPNGACLQSLDPSDVLVDVHGDQIERLLRAHVPGRRRERGA